MTKTIISFDGETHILNERDSMIITAHQTPIQIEVVSDDAAQKIQELGEEKYECGDPPHEHTDRIKNT